VRARRYDGQSSAPLVAFVETLSSRDRLHDRRPAATFRCSRLDTNEMTHLMHFGSISPRLFATVFGVIFLAELPDKTALAALVLATRHRALPVFLGASLALTVQSVIAVAFGALLSKLPQHWVHIGAGLLFLACGVLMWLRKHDEHESDVKHAHAAGFWSALWTVFVVVFVAEWGDLTQIGTAGFQAKYHAWLTIFVASSLALWAVAGIAVFVGNRAGKLLDAKLTQKIAAVVFAIIGVLLVAGVV
jgi:Ca2+/H+ antiporter, TMEM165/GDT1 family